MSDAIKSKSAPIDPAKVPQRKLSTGATMPAVGLGTFGSDHVTADQVAEAVTGAAAVGYRHFDCASVYGNEPEVGGSLQAILRNGIKREELWITSKLWNDKHGERCHHLVLQIACRSSTRLPRPLPHPLALSEFPSAALRCHLAQPRRQAIHPRELHEDMAQDGGACGPRAGASYRHLQHDHPQAQACPPRRAHQARGQ